MISKEDLKPINLKSPQSIPSAEHISNGIRMPPQLRLKTFDSDSWEEFTLEWAYSLKEYSEVRRFGGAGDQGLDVIGLLDEDCLSGVWDNYQCKHYKSPLTPTDVYVEVGKIIFYSFKKEYSVPRMYYFIAPQGIGSTLNKLLQLPEEFQKKTRSNWEKYCQSEITKSQKVLLEGAFLDWFNNFDFSIFSHKSPLDIIEQHKKTKYHAYRFGGGLPDRPLPNIPNSDINEEKSIYIQQIFKAYSQKTNTIIDTVSDIPSPQLKKNFSRQRISFYHAESLKKFAQDTVPQGTFERLCNEIHEGVIEIVEDDHENGYQRMTETLKKSADIVIHSNPLVSALEIQDKKGICHHLVNNEKISWVLTEEDNENDQSI